jgi:hypothetical protein
MTPIATRAISGGALAMSLMVICVLAASPFVVAHTVADRRIAVARARASQIAAALRDVSRAADRGAVVLVGIGNLPRFDSVPDWPINSSAQISQIVPEHSAAGSITDPWRNAYLVNLGARGAIWVLSAGPNGILETPYESAATLRGDDIGARMR